MKKLKIPTIIIWILFCVSAIVFIYKCTDVLPAKYILCLAVICLLFLSLFILFSKWKVSRILCNALALFLCICLGLGSFYLTTIENTLVEVQNKNYSSVYIGVYVLADDAAESIEDTTGYLYGYDYMYNEDETAQAISYVEEILGDTPDTATYESMFDMLDDLASQNVNAILLNEAYMEIAWETEEGEWAEEGTKQIASIEVQTSDDSEVKEAADTETETETKDTFIVYISGIDSYGEVSTKSRSDVNILAVVNMNTQTVALITTPRDYYVEYEATGGMYDKLTHAGLLGVTQSEDALERLYDIDIDYYVKLNFTGFVDIIDALGGITVYSDYTFSSSISDYSYVEGYNYLDGEAALYFARERKSFTDGDFQRGRNQMIVIKAVINKLASFSTIANFQSVMAAVSESVETDMASSTINSLIKKVLAGDGNWTVEQYETTGTTGYATTYYTPNQKLSVVFQDEESIAEAKELIASVLE